MINIDSWEYHGGWFRTLYPVGSKPLKEEMMYEPETAHPTPTSSVPPLRLPLATAAGAGPAVQLAPAAGASVPTTPVTRPEVRELTPQQWQDFVAAVHTLRSVDGEDLYSSLVTTHMNAAEEAHGNPNYLSWHRAFLSQYEKSLQRINSAIALPYWDWSLDSQRPEQSPVLGPSYFGGTGEPATGVVVDGAFANWHCTVPASHSLRRSGLPIIASFCTPEALENILSNSQSYDRLQRSLEAAPHGLVHVGIGGLLGDMSFMHAPNDPLFWAAECFIDLLWAEWQQRNPHLANTYNGGNAQPSDILNPFGVTVSSTFDTSALGYTYPRWSAGRP